MWTPLMVNIYEIRPSHSDAVAMAGLTGPDWILVRLGPVSRAAVLSTGKLLARSIPKHSVAGL